MDLHHQRLVFLLLPHLLLDTYHLPLLLLLHKLHQLQLVVVQQLFLLTLMLEKILPKVSNKNMIIFSGLKKVDKKAV
jgi:hypothetical protein